MAKALPDMQSALTPSAAVGAGMGIIRRDPALPEMHRLQPAELRHWCERAIAGIAMWASGQEFAEVMNTFSELGHDGQHLGIPGRELLHALTILMSVYEAHDIEQEMALGAVSRNESLRPMDSFHDFAKYYLIRGYEDSNR